MEVQTVNVNVNVSPETITEVLKRDGCIVIEGLLEQKELRSLQDDLEFYFDKKPNCQGEFYGYSTKRISGLFAKSPITQKMATLPIILSIMDDFLLKGCEEYQINLTQGISIGSGEDPQIIHQDDSMFPFMHPDYEVMINCMWAVDDFTKENGATQLAPGSHKWKRSKIIDLEKMRIPQPSEIIQGVMKAGSVLIYLGSLYHSGGRNITNKPRRGAVISYCLGWIRQAENSYLAYSKEEVRNMSKHLQRLLGYFVHAPNLGSVEGRDPIDFINDASSSEQVFQEFIPEEAREIIKNYKTQLKHAA